MSTDRASPAGRDSPDPPAAPPGTRPGRPLPVRLAELLTQKRRPDRSDLATECRQCGQWRPVSILRLSTRRARYWCQRCGAVVVWYDTAGLRPRQELRSAAPSPAPTVDPRLSELMPAAMCRWVMARPDRPRPQDPLDKQRINRLYREWDAHLRAGPDRAPSEPATGGGTVPGLPTFPQVVAALDRACYHPDQALRALLESQPDRPDRPEPSPAFRAALRERVAHAHRWLARYAAEQRWIHAAAAPDVRGSPEQRQEVTEVRDRLVAGDHLDYRHFQVLRTAVFGVADGPRFEAIAAVYPTDRVLAAIETYLDSGERPLRDDVLAHLATPLTKQPPGQPPGQPTDQLPGQPPGRPDA